jgi:serine/threonine protein kinase
LNGTDLSDRLTSGQPWTRVDASRLFASVCEGLSALQEQKIVHRDLKPSNIRVRPDGTPVIIDFGLARHLDQPDLTTTNEGAAFGTPLYFAPEQFLGTKRDIDHRTDLFAIGILLYFAIAGYHPFLQPGMTLAQLQDAICNSENHFNTVEFLALPQRWQTIVRRLLEKDRASRPHAASQVATILHKLEGI